MSLHDKRFPGESGEYRSGRNELLQAELDLRNQVEEVAARRRNLPPGSPVKEDYVFQEESGNGSSKPARLSELFASGKTALVIYSFMFGPKMKNPCPMCTSIIDGFNGSSPHVTDRVNLVVVARSPIDRIMKFARDRNWDRIRFLSSEANSYNTDYWAEDPEGNQMPMINVFVKGEGSIRHFWGSELLYAKVDGHPRHVDLLWPLWNILDLTPDGRGTDWYPKLNYP